MTLLAATVALVLPSPVQPDINYATYNKPIVIAHHHHHKRHHKQLPMQTALASYYDLHGTGACNVGDVQQGYRFASLILACGQRVLFCFQRCVTAVMSDHGPYVAGRTFDLNVNLKDALNCPDLCSVRWRTVGG